MSLKQIDHLAAMQGQILEKKARLSVNLRPGQALELKDGCAPSIVVKLVGRHGQGARIEVVAFRSVKVTSQPDP